MRSLRSHPIHGVEYVTLSLRLVPPDIFEMRLILRAASCTFFRVVVPVRAHQMNRNVRLVAHHPTIYHAPVRYKKCRRPASRSPGPHPSLPSRARRPPSPHAPPRNSSLPPRAPHALTISIPVH